MKSGYCAARRRRGFSIKDAVVVLVIIATIAGFVIPQIGMIGLRVLHQKRLAGLPQ